MIAQYKNDFFPRQHFSLNIGSEVLRLQDFAQIILKFSWGGGICPPPPFHIVVDRYFSGQWNFEGASCSKILLYKGPVKKIFLSRLLESNPLRFIETLISFISGFVYCLYMPGLK